MASEGFFRDGGERFMVKVQALALTGATRGDAAGRLRIKKIEKSMEIMIFQYNYIKF